MGSSDEAPEDEELDPRVEGALLALNQATNHINACENELEVGFAARVTHVAIRMRQSLVLPPAPPPLPLPPYSAYHHHTQAAKKFFKQSMDTLSKELRALSSKIGRKTIEKARPYHDLLVLARKVVSLGL